MAILNELATVVKQQRLDMGLSQDRLAQLSDLSRATLNDLETGKITNLSLTRAERLANVLGYGLGITGLLKAKEESDALATAARTASVSFRTPIPPETLRETLLRGFVPPSYIPQLRAFLDEAPVGVLSAVAAQLERENGVSRKDTWQKMRQLAAALACTRNIWS
jgi:transcriptional regulator with XRE-family HTH domain